MNVYVCFIVHSCVQNDMFVVTGNLKKKKGGELLVAVHLGTLWEHCVSLHCSFVRTSCLEVNFSNSVEFPVPKFE